MTIEHLFFTLLRAGLWEQSVRLSSLGDIDLGQIIELAKSQSVLGIVVRGLENVVDLDIKLPETISEDIVEMEKWNRMMSFSIGVFVEKLREAGIDTLLVKGQGIAQCYERPLRRSAGDIDFFLDAENYEKAKVFFVPLATRVGKEEVKRKHFNFTIDPWKIELHGTMHGGLTKQIDDELDRIQEDTFSGNVRVWDDNGVEVHLPGVDDDIVFVFAHILQHFFQGGIGVRQICDWCRLLWTYNDSVDQSLLETRLQRMKVMREWKAFATYAVEYLGMPKEAMPFYEESNRLQRYARRINSFVLEVGNFGRNRDTSFYSKYPYLIYKAISLGRHCGDFFRHLVIFPRTALSVFFRTLFTGFHVVARGE